MEVRPRKEWEEWEEQERKGLAVVDNRVRRRRVMARLRLIRLVKVV